MAFGCELLGFKDSKPFSGENPFTSDIKGKISHRDVVLTFAFISFHPPFVVDRDIHSPYMPHFLIHPREEFFHFSTHPEELVAGLSLDNSSGLA